MKSCFYLFSVTLLLCNLHNLTAQNTATIDEMRTSKKETSIPRWEMGVYGGLGIYQGDLTPVGFLQVDRLPDIRQQVRAARPSFMLQLRYQVNRFFTLRAQTGVADLRMDEVAYTLPTTYQHKRGFSFTNRVSETSILTEFDLFGKYKVSRGKRRYRWFSPYALAGVGLAAINPRTQFNTTNTNNESILPLIEQDRSATYNKMLLAVPVGGGLRFGLGQHWSFNVESAYRFAFSDYVDGVSLSADPNSRDAYLTAGAALVYRFHKSDRDKDGIADGDDDCPREKGTLEAGGCPDSDKDGVPDHKDRCPNEAGPAALKGCPQEMVNDTDGDGLVDREDECPDKAGPAENKGCPTPEMEAATRDTDGDGVVDRQDKCPEKAGEQRWDGCPDTDGDGLPDHKDGCPNETGTADGCPDSDKDGIADRADKCPSVPGVPERAGCPLNKNDADFTVTPLLNKTVYYSTNVNGYDPRYEKVLEDVASILRANPTYGVRIEGHTDNTGRYPGNQRLSETRARTCYEILMKKGIAEERMSWVGHSDRRPVASNNTYEGRAQNRRVEFLIYGL